ncbi:MAG: hypothetical protein V4659_04020 [Pseudomonadota bacterium]
MIKITETTLMDGSKVYGVSVPDLGEIDCLDERAAYDLANTIERTTNLQFDGWATVKAAA